MKKLNPTCGRTLFLGVSSVIEGDNSAYTPFLTTSYTVNDYLEDDLSIFNYNTTSVSTGVFSYYGGRNTYFARVIYNMDRSTENDTEDFSEFFTEVGLITSFQIVDSLGLNSTFGLVNILQQLTLQVVPPRRPHG